jgi:hypothetical protein
LQEIVTHLLANGQRLRASLSQVALAERSSVLATKSVQDVPATPEEVARAERVLINELAARGQVVTAEQARAMIHEGRAFSVRLKANQSFIGGKKYDNAAFGPLPQYESSFELLRQLALEEATVIVGWFLNYGYAIPSPEVDDIFFRIGTLSAHQVALLSK